jgi:hypothetical protein
MTTCRECGKDFGGVSSFDAHRVGKHEYTYSEGLKQDTPVEDGRRCLSTREMTTYGVRKGVPVFTLNKYGTWSLTGDLERARSLNE